MNQPKTNDLQAQLASLFSRINYERRAGLKPFDFKLDGMIQLLNRLDNPHLKYRVVHIAGTKGKGSVSKMLGRILEANGKKTGVYTSPHLESINQRISVNNQWISDTDLASALSDIQPDVDELDRQSELAGIRPLTFFEVITAAAFFHFAQVSCDAVVLEVGMGGRLDSTNVCEPDLGIITNIYLDHTRQLGNTLEKIAREKAGIIKPNVPLICGATQRKPKEAIHQIAKSRNATVWQLHEDFDVQSSVGHRDLRFDTQSNTPNVAWSFENVHLPVFGEHQATNAAIAIAAVQRLNFDGWKIQESEIRGGLSGLQLPCRSELIRENPPTVVDMAHNVASIEALIKTLEKQFPKWNDSKRKRLILAISRDKDARGIIRWLVDTFDEIVLTKYESNPRGKPIDQLLEIAEVTREGLKTETTIRTANSPSEAWDIIRKDVRPDDFVCVTGSVFLAAELRPLLIASQTDAE